MGRGKLTETEIKMLKSNPHVLEVTGNAIAYTAEFKLFFMQEYLSGKKPRQIFSDAGFDTQALGTKRIERATARWKESYLSGTLGEKQAVLKSKKSGCQNGLNRKSDSNKKDLVKKCHQQEKEIQKLTAQVKLLQSLREYERDEFKQSLSKEEVCRIIDQTAMQEKGGFSISALCEIVGVSRAYLYAYRKKVQDKL